MVDKPETVRQARKGREKAWAADLEGWLTQRDTFDLCVWKRDAQVGNGEHAVEWLNEELELKNVVSVAIERRTPTKRPQYIQGVDLL